MASTFKNLGDDVLSEARIYTEKLVITDEILMRYMSRAVQVLQREAEIAEAIVTLVRTDTTLNFIEPDDVLRPAELIDSTGLKLIEQEWRQQQTQAERAKLGYLDSPYPTSSHIGMDSGYGVGSIGSDISGGTYRHYARYNRRIYLLPDTGDTSLTYYYIPDLKAISRNSAQWTAWYTSDAAFEAQYQQAELIAVFQPYEQAIVDYAVMRILRSQTSPNYKVYEQNFWSEVERAKANKPSLFRDAVAVYYMSPDR